MSTQLPEPSRRFEKVVARWRRSRAQSEKEGQTDSPHGWTIAISREAGAGGLTTARVLAQKLDWPLYDRELMEEISKDASIHDELLARFDEKQPNWLTECLEGLSGEKHMTGGALAIRLKRMLLALYGHGNCIVVGRGAAQVLPHKRSLFVRMIAPLDYRIARMASQWGISDKEAKKRIAETDRGRAEFVQSYYHKDLSDPYAYDMVINYAGLGESACVAIILAALNSRCDQARD
jgi:cytidylate kinase